MYDSPIDDPVISDDIRGAFQTADAWIYAQLYSFQIYVRPTFHGEAISHGVTDDSSTCDGQGRYVGIGRREA